MKLVRMVLVGALLCFLATAGGVSVTAQPQGPGAPTFNTDVAPILFNSCVTCHRPGQVAPMSLVSYADARPWARAIK